jgi:hypothetical protein
MGAECRIFVALQQRVRIGGYCSTQPQKTQQQQGGQPMESKKIAKQLVEFQKATFNNAFTALVMVQDQTEAMFKSMMSQVPGMPEEGKKMVQEWADAYKKGRETYKKAVDDGFEKLDSFLVEGESAKSKK